MRLCSDIVMNELIGSGEDSSGCNSSRMSTKSEKNMADFDGENVLSDDEIARLTSAPAAATAQQGMSQERMQRHLTSLADEGYKDAQRGAYAWLRIHCLGTLYYTMYNTHV